MNTDDIECEVRRNLMLAVKALDAGAWKSVLSLAEGIVRLCIKRDVLIEGNQ